MHYLHNCLDEVHVSDILCKDQIGPVTSRKANPMTHILRIDASSRPAAVPSDPREGSFSRAIADHIQQAVERAHPGATITELDLARAPVPHISDATIKGYYTPAEAMTDESRGATALSDRLIADLQRSDVLLLSVPIYNFSVPSALKAWIDQIVRINATFAYEDGQFRGLLSGKRAYVALAYGAGGYGSNGPLQAYDYLRPYLQMILNFIGIEEVHFFSIEATTADPETVAEQKATAQRAVDRHFVGKEVA